jgi:Protein of unknown function (DUF3168)
VTDLCVPADPISAVRSFLADQALVAAVVGDRMATELPRNPTWPALRIALVSSTATGPPRLDRALFQIDCFATDAPSAQALARLVRAALAAAGNYQTPNAVLSGGVDLSIRPLATEVDYSPAVYVVAVSAAVYLHPNP